VRFTGVKFEETILAWDEGARWAFRVDSAQAPVFDAFVEDYHFEPDGSDATLLRWTIAYKPRLAFKLARPLLPRALTLVLTRAGHNLEHGRWFSAPPPTHDTHGLATGKPLLSGMSFPHSLSSSVRNVWGWRDQQLRDGTTIWESPSMTRTSPHRLRRCCVQACVHRPAN
jgi:Polyketide cyclase / dehydrase and lipid transport